MFKPMYLLSAFYNILQLITYFYNKNNFIERLLSDR